MRLARLLTEHGPAVVAVTEDGMVDLTAALNNMTGGEIGSLADVIEAGDDSFAALHEHVASATPVPQKGARLLLPHLPSGPMFCVGANYREHAEEGQRAAAFTAPEDATWFSRDARSLCGPEDDIVVSAELTSMLDWEVELAVVIGRGGRAIEVGDALDHVFGYTIVNDVSARDVQLGRGQWFLGKNLQATGPVGPWIVTADEVVDPQKLDLSLSVDGEVKQQASTQDMTHSVAELISDLSTYLELRPGDVISTGTPAGVGGAMSPPQFLRDGSVVEARITGLGRQQNRVRIV